MQREKERPSADIRESMKRSRIFSGLNAESTDRIIQRLKPVNFSSESIICHEGEIGDCLYIISSGEVAVLKEMVWGYRELQRMKAGEIFGEMALISAESRSATVKAVKDTECLRLNESDFAQLLNDDSRFAQQVAQILTKRLADLGQRSSEDLVHSYRALMFSLAGLAETRDPDTGAHLERTRNYCALLSDLLSKTDGYRETITSTFIDSIFMVSPLHDIGKVAIPDSILLKPAKLTADEYDTMKTHTTIGAQALQNVLRESDQEIFHMGYRICLYHHEKWDGTGYPTGLTGSDIPVEARVMMLADIFDALLSERVYKPPMNMPEVCKEIDRSAGTFFDPVIAETVLSNIDLFEKVNRRYQD